jgi:hypothetical protein
MRIGMQRAADDVVDDLAAVISTPQGTSCHAFIGIGEAKLYVR